MTAKPKYGINQYGVFKAVDCSFDLSGPALYTYEYVVKSVANFEIPKGHVNCFITPSIHQNPRQFIVQLKRDLVTLVSMWRVDEWYYVDGQRMYGSKSGISGIHGVWIRFKHFGIEDICMISIFTECSDP